MYAPTSSSCWTVKPVTDILPGLWSYDVIQKIYPSVKLLRDPAFWSFTKFWFQLNNDKLAYARDKFQLVSLSDKLLKELLTENIVDPEKWNYKADAYAYMFKYLDKQHVFADNKQERIDSIIHSAEEKEF